MFQVKIFITNDVIGTCICGAVKNVIAVASGIINGLGYPISTQAMLITQSLHDIKELINKLGGTEWEKTKLRVKNKVKDIAEKYNSYVYEWKK